MAHSTGRGLPQPKGASDWICRTVSSVSWQNGPSASTRISPIAHRAGRFAGRMLAERRAKGIDPRFVDLQARGAGVAADSPADAREHAASAACRFNPFGERAEPTPGLMPSCIERDQHDRPMIFFGQPAGDQADHAGVPAAAGQHQRRIALGIELFLDLLRRRPVECSAPGFRGCR